MRLGFAKGHHKNHTQRKSGPGPKLGELPKFFRFPFDISAKTEDSDFKTGRLVGFAKAHHKVTPRGKVSVALGWGAPQNFRVPF